MRYNRSCLRETLKQLTNSEFDESLDDFPRVREQFTRGMVKHRNQKLHFSNFYNIHQAQINVLIFV